MKTTLRTEITVADICDGFVYNQLEGKGLYGLGGKLTIQPEYQRNIAGDRRLMPSFAGVGVVSSWSRMRFPFKKQRTFLMDKSKWIVMGVTLVVVIVGVIIANIAINKVAPLNKLAKG